MHTAHGSVWKRARPPEFSSGLSEIATRAVLTCPQASAGVACGRRPSSRVRSSRGVSFVLVMLYLGHELVSEVVCPGPPLRSPTPPRKYLIVVPSVWARHKSKSGVGTRRVAMTNTLCHKNLRPIATYSCSIRPLVAPSENDRSTQNAESRERCKIKETKVNREVNWYSSIFKLRVSHGRV